MLDSRSTQGVGVTTPIILFSLTSSNSMAVHLFLVMIPIGIWYTATGDQEWYEGMSQLLTVRAVRSYIRKKRMTYSTAKPFRCWVFNPRFFPGVPATATVARASLWLPGFGGGYRCRRKGRCRCGDGCGGGNGGRGGRCRCNGSAFQLDIGEGSSQTGWGRTNPNGRMSALQHARVWHTVQIDVHISGSRLQKYNGSR